MEDIIKTIVAKTGISESVARTAVETIVAHLKDKLPAGIGEQVAAFLGGKTAGAGDNPLGGVTDMLGGMFGKK